MGFSKKKSKAFVKHQARAGPKAKAKVKKSAQIAAATKIKDSKREAAKITGKGEKKARGLDADLIDEIKTVDDLFTKVGGETGDGEAEDDDGSDSSAGAFMDGDGDSDGDEGPDEPWEVETDEEDAAQHEQDLASIKDKDPEFYKFLVEQDRALLDFKAPEQEEEDDEGPGEEDEEEGPKGKKAAKAAQAVPTASILTAERFVRVQETARESFTSCKAALNAYHAAVRSIEKAPENEDDPQEEEDGETGKTAAARRRRKRKALLQIDNEETFSKVLEWSIANLLGVFKTHAGEPKVKGPGGKRKDKDRKGKKGGEEDEDDEPAPRHASLIDPQAYTRWSRVKVMAQIFWEETFFLLNHLKEQQMVEYVLRSISTPDALSWLWPFKNLRSKYLKCCCGLWSTSPSHSVRLLAFLLIRNSAAMVLHAPEGGMSVKDAGQLEVLIKNVLRTFADTAAGGYSWRALSTFRFMENCTIELFTLEDNTTYRVGYIWIRQLALILRNACIATSQGGDAAKAGSTEKGKKKGLVQKQAQSLVSWPFVRSLYLWTKAAGSVKALRPLSYPLAMITMGAVKSKLTNLQHFPFVFHCLQCLNRLAASTETFVPVASYILKALSVLLQAMDKAHKKGGKQGKAEKGFGGTRAPDVEVILRLSEAQLGEVLTLETMGSSLIFLLTDHLGLLSQSPAFPEVSALVLLHLRKYGKNCRSEPLRRQMKSLTEKAETSADTVRARREQLSEAPSAKKFLVFEPDSALAKARTEALRRRATEERSRVEAEMREAAKEKEKGAKGSKKTGKGDPRKKGEDQEDEDEEEAEEGEAGEPKEGEGKSAHAKKRRRKKEKAEAEKEKAAADDRKRRKAVAPLPKGDKDMVEEMGFGSDVSDE